MILNINLYPVKKEKELEVLKKVNALKDGFMILTAILTLFFKRIFK